MGRLERLFNDIWCFAFSGGMVAFGIFNGVRNIIQQGGVTWVTPLFAVMAAMGVYLVKVRIEERKLEGEE